MSGIRNFDQSPLPLARMESLLPDAKIKYQEGVPFPHFVFDDFFDDNVVEKYFQSFPEQAISTGLTITIEVKSNSQMKKKVI